MLDISPYSIQIAIAGLYIYPFIIFSTCFKNIKPPVLFVAAVSLPLAQLSLGFFLSLTTRLLPKIYDQTLAGIDGTLGFQPGAEIAWLLWSMPALRTVCVFVYMLYLVSIGISAGYELRSGTIRGIGVIPTVVVAGLLGYAVYFLVPAVGAAEFFGANYEMLLRNPDLVGGQYDFSNSPRNCVPSLHTTWAALAFLATRNRPTAIRALSGCFLFLTMIACMGLGGHYLVDLVVAAPFVLLVRAVCAVQLKWSTERGLGALVGLGLVVAWCVALRTDQPPALAPRDCTAGDGDHRSVGHRSGT